MRTYERVPNQPMRRNQGHSQINLNRDYVYCIANNAIKRIGFKCRTSITTQVYNIKCSKTTTTPPCPLNIKTHLIAFSSILKCSIQKKKAIMFYK